MDFTLDGLFCRIRTIPRTPLSTFAFPITAHVKGTGLPTYSASCLHRPCQRRKNGRNILTELTFQPITAQHWSKKVLKEFKERHGADNDNGDGGSTSLTVTPTNKKAAAKNTPHKSRTPKTPKTGGNKKRAAADDDTSPDGPVPNPIAQTKASRSVSKKVKYEETKGVEDGESDDESDAQEVKAKVEEDGDFGVA